MKEKKLINFVFDWNNILLRITHTYGNSLLKQSKEWQYGQMSYIDDH